MLKFHVPPANARVAAAALLCAIVAGPFERAAADETPSAVVPAASQAAASQTAAPEQIAEWIDQLDHQRYSVRERAETLLKAAGPPALDAVAAAACDPSLERSTRAVRVLLAWSEAGDAEYRLAVLERLAEATETHPTEAAYAGEQTYAVRETAALESLAKMGAIDNLSSLAPPARRSAPIHIIIGPKWTGGDEGLATLADLRRLRVLSFHSAPVTAEGLRQVKEIPSLQRLEVYGTPHTPEVLAEIQASLPGLAELAVRSGAQLGVQGDASGNQPLAVVEHVYPDTAAARAGIQDRDVITAVDDQEVGNFESLTKKIAQYQPGDSVTVTVQRGDDELKLPVTFDRWGENDQFTLANMRANQGGLRIRANGGRVIINGQQRIVVPVQPAAPKAR